MTKHAAVTTVNYAGRSSQLQHKMVKALPLSIAVGTLLLAPIWVQHLVSKDGGLIAIGGGKLSEEDLFGDGKKKKGMHPIVFHLTAVAGIAHFALSFMAIAATYYGDKMVKKAITAIYAVWVACIMIVQYTHPWTGAAPESLLEMPAPLVYVIGSLVALGWYFDGKKSGASASTSKTPAKTPAKKK